MTVSQMHGLVPILKIRVITFTCLTRLSENEVRSALVIYRVLKDFASNSILYHHL